MSIRASLMLVLAIMTSVITYHSCSMQGQLEPPSSITAQDITPHIQELADDKYLGRMPFGLGDPMAVSYIVNQCKALDLKPANNGSFTQSVPMVEITSSIAEPMEIKTPTGNRTYQFGQDYVIQCQKTVSSIKINEAPLVFCGFGIKDDMISWDDYAGIDMRGKVAVVMVNDPGFGSEREDFFKGNTMTYYGRWTYKYEEADRQGLAGLLIIHEKHAAGYPWFVVQSSWTGAQLGLEKESVEQGADFKGWIHLDMAKDLFAACNLDLSQMMKDARTPGFKPVDMSATISTALNNTIKRDKSDNVLAYLEGSEHPDEFILYSAHWDHIGVGAPVDGDSIYNGALDNASGTATVLAIAKNLVDQKNRPKRSILFAFVTAEEQGLLGSEYLSLNPVVPNDQIVANINIDGCNPNGQMKDFQIVGIGHSDMDQIAEEELAKQNRYVLPDQEPEKGYFFRSDHFNFAKVGIPALFGEGGYDHVEHGIEYGKAKKDEYTAKNYHAPSDEYDAATWDMGGVVQDAQLYYNVGWRLANSTEWPQWKATSEFRRPTNLKD